MYTLLVEQVGLEVAHECRDFVLHSNVFLAVQM